MVVSEVTRLLIERGRKYAHFYSCVPFTLQKFLWVNFIPRKLYTVSNSSSTISSKGRPSQWLRAVSVRSNAAYDYPTVLLHNNITEISSTTI